MKLTKIASVFLTTLFSISILFHLLILFQFIDFKNVWGGKLKTLSEMYVFESISIVLNIYFLMVILSFTNFKKIIRRQTVLKISLWIMCILFSLNTLGNLLANNNFEKYGMSTLTLLSAISIFIILKDKTSQIS